MQALRRLLATLAATLLLVAVAPGAARADEWGDVDCGSSPGTPSCTVEVGYTGGGNGNNGGSGGDIACTIGGQVVECQNAFGWLGSDGCYYGKDSGGFLPTNQWIKTCINPETDETTDWGVVTLLEPPAVIALVIQRAVDSLEIPNPVIASNPKFAATQVVWVPVWWWVEPGWWQTQTASASAGSLTITARAVPQKIVWDAGDGTSTVCTGPGTPWAASTNMNAASPDCGHTYTTPSGGAGYTVRAVATFDISWSGGGLAGTEPAMTTSTTADVTVTEQRSVMSG